MDIENKGYELKNDPLLGVYYDLRELLPGTSKERKKGYTCPLTNTLRPGYETLAARTARYLMTVHRASENYGAALTRLPKLKSELLGLLDADDELSKSERRAMKTLLGYYYGMLLTIFSPWREEYNGSYREKVTTRSKVENRVYIDQSDFLEFANRVLEEPSKATWQEVAISLAILTGRRMAEIFYSGCLEVTEDTLSIAPHWENRLLFSGQAKTKSDVDRPYIVPVLAPTADVLRLWYHPLMETKRKSVASKRDVNARYSRYLSEAMRKYFPKREEAEQLTFHNLRAVYFRIIFEQLGGEAVFDYRSFVLATLGDNDSETAESYARFRLA